MARRKRSKRKRRWTMPEIDFDWDIAHRTVVVAAWVLGAGGLAAAWVLGVPRLEAYASARPGPGEVEVRYVDPPSWLDGDLEASLVLTAEEHIDPDPQNRQGLVVVRQALLATGWFNEIAQVRRVDRGLVEIDARFAQPFAVIRHLAAAADHLVDSRGRLLPRAFPVGQAEHFTTIVGAGFDRPSRPGEHWPGTDVTAALKVLHLIHDRPWRGQVAEIDVASYLREASISLVTDRGCVIRWGRAPGDELGGEVSAEQKLSYLDYHQEHYGHIDRGFLQEIDITGDVVIGR
ncbi:MAG: hypothetical protein ACYTE6_13380 [Planctomycetota bacterium]